MKLKKLLKAITVTFVVALLSVSLTGCMSINMREENLVQRMKDGGYTVSYVPSTDWTSDGSNYNVSFTKIIRAEKASASSVCYVYFCTNKKSSDWVKTRCQGNSNTSAAPVKDYITYVYSNANIVVYGDYAAVSLARTY